MYLIGDTGRKSSLLKSMYGELKSTNELLLQTLTYLKLSLMKSLILEKIRNSFQDFQLLNDRTIFKNLNLFKINRWKNHIEINQRIEQVLESVHLAYLKIKCLMIYQEENSKERLLQELC